MISKENKELTLKKQCELAGIASSTICYHPKPERAENVLLMERIDEIYTERPYYGARRIQKALSSPDQLINIKRIRRLMKTMALLPRYAKPNTSKCAPQHKKDPYLLSGLEITAANQVWSMDIAYVKMKRGYMYLTHRCKSACMDEGAQQIMHSLNDFGDV